MADDLRLQVSQVLLSSGTLLGVSQEASDVEAVEQLAPILQNAIQAEMTEELLDILQELEANTENEVRDIAEDPENPCFDAIDQFNEIQSRARDISVTVRQVSMRLERSGNDLVDKASQLLMINRTRENIESAIATVRVCLQALEHTNQVHQQLKNKNRIAAVINIHDLQSLQLDKLRSFGLANMISRAVPALTELTVLNSLDAVGDYFGKLGQQIPTIGVEAYDLLRQQRHQWVETLRIRPYLQQFRFNSVVERAYRESTHNYLTDDNLSIDLSTLYETELVFTKLEMSPRLVSAVSENLRMLSESLVHGHEGVSEQMLQSVTGFCVTDRHISRKLPKIRLSKTVDDTWEHMSQHIASQLAAQFPKLEKIDDLKAHKQMICSFLETLENFSFNVFSILSLLRDLFVCFSERMVRSFRDSFHLLLKEGDQMPMVITDRKLYEDVMRVIWYNVEDGDSENAENLTFPRVLPFSELYPVTCANVRELIQSHSDFYDQFQQNPTFVEDTLMEAVDTYLADVVCQGLLDNLNHSNREQLLQTICNIQCFMQAVPSIQELLESLRLSGRRGKIFLRAEAAFAEGYRIATEKTHALFESNVLEFFDMESYNWHTKELMTGPSAYVTDMSTFLTTQFEAALNRMPEQLRELLKMNIANVLNKCVIDLVKAAPANMTPEALANLDLDLCHIEAFVNKMDEGKTEGKALAMDIILESRQCVNLLRSEDPYEFNKPEIRAKQYSRLSNEIVANLISKRQTPTSSPWTPQTKFMKYLS